MTIDRFKVRWNESKTPFMTGHMRQYYYIYRYVSKLPRTRQFMMYSIRRKFRRKRSRGVKE